MITGAGMASGCPQSLGVTGIGEEVRGGGDSQIFWLAVNEMGLMRKEQLLRRLFLGLSLTRGGVQSVVRKINWGMGPKRGTECEVEGG